jgi:hypothetical protein
LQVLKVLQEHRDQQDFKDVKDFLVLRAHKAHKVQVVDPAVQDQAVHQDFKVVLERLALKGAQEQTEF